MASLELEDKRASRSPRPKRRYDYPEALYTAPRVSDSANTPPVSPTTPSMVPASLRPQRAPSVCSSWSVYSREQSEDNADSPAASPRQTLAVVATEGPMDFEQAEAVHKREGTKSAPPQDSTVQTGGLSLRYSHVEAAEPAVAGEDGAQYPSSEYNEAHDQPISPTNGMFVFARENPRDVSTPTARMDKTPALRLQSYAMGRWRSKTDGPSVVPCAKSSRFSEDVEISPPLKRWRFDSLRQSIGDISASLKQVAGRKRSRDEDEEALIEQRPVKATRKIVPTAPQIPALPPDVSSSMADEEPTAFVPAPRKRNARALLPQLRLSDASVQDLLASIERRRSEVYAEPQDPCHGPRDHTSGEDAGESCLTSQERAEFGAFVRAAEAGSWRMSVDQAVEGARRGRV